MPDTERIERLTALAATITHLSVHEQLQTLGKAGLELTDTNWENCNTDPGATVIIPLKKSGQGGKHT